MTRLLAISLLATAWLASLSIVACGGRAEAEKIGAAAAGAIEMGIDPETTGNTASTLGTLEPCVRVDVSSPAFDGVSDYNIDIYVKGDTQAPVGYDASVTYDQNIVHVAAPGTDVLIKMPGATSMADTGTPPDTDGTFYAGVLYFDPAESRIPGDGVLVRLGLDIGGSALVTFALNPPWSDYESGSGIHTVTVVPAQLAINQDCPR